MADVAELVRHDRYQASDGIEAAAAYVAERATAAGVTDVEVIRYPADGGRRWWTFTAPQAWTPRGAELRLESAPGTVVASYPRDPYRLAAHSAPTPDGGVCAPLAVVDDPAAQPLRGAVALLDPRRAPLRLALPALDAAGVVGVVIGRPDGEPGQASRVELPPYSCLFAFSVPGPQMRQLLDWARAGRRVNARVSVARDASMPVVTGVLPGTDAAGEALLCAHLCHPRPGANDNASGVAALLAIARLLGAWRREASRHQASGRQASHRKGIRFLWGPEFTGLAAYLHDEVAAGHRPRPLAALNLDMVGEDQRRCGGPLIVERSPDHLPCFMNALAEHIAGLLPQAARSYSGAIACDTWAWRATPFVGASDHAVLADRSLGCPALQVGHWPDRFNHSSFDTLDKVDPNEVRRCSVLAASTVAVAAMANTDVVEELERLVLRWGADLLHECLPAGGWVPTDADWTDPLAPLMQAGRLRHRTEVAASSLRRMSDLDGGAGSHRRLSLERWLRDLAAHVRAALPQDRDVSARDTERLLVPRWPGPFNMRGLSEVAEPNDRCWLEESLAKGGGGAYARFLALAHSLDGTRGHRAACRWAAYASGLAVHNATARRFFDLMIRAGWVSEPAGGNQGDLPKEPCCDST